jgi:hypothetical protein
MIYDKAILTTVNPSATLSISIKLTGILNPNTMGTTKTFTITTLDSGKYAID